MSSQLVDLHCHILPGIDDGAKNLDVSMSLIQKEMEDPISELILQDGLKDKKVLHVGKDEKGKLTFKAE